MSCNLTDSQKDLVRWLVEQKRAGNLPEEFSVLWMPHGGQIPGLMETQPPITKGALDALASAEMLLCSPNLDKPEPNRVEFAY